MISVVMVCQNVTMGMMYSIFMEWNRMEWNGIERYNTYSDDIVLYLVHFYNIIIIYICMSYIQVSDGFIFTCDFINDSIRIVNLYFWHNLIGIL